MEIEILNDERLRDWCTRLRIPEPGCLALIDAAHRTLQDPQLMHQFTELHVATAQRDEWHRDWSELPMDPYVQQELGERASLFYLLAYMAALPRAEAEYCRRGISADIFDETMADITFYYLEDSEVHGDWRFNQFQWIWRHLSCRLFRLGRLQYILEKFDYGVTAFRRAGSGEILLLADPNRRLRPDGSAEGAGGRPAGGPTWWPVFEQRPDGWFGHPINPYGYALPEPRFLPATEWQPALQRGDTVLEIHIPRGKSLTAEECSSSLRCAGEFFAWQNPENPFRATFCHTWFFTPQLQQMLPPESSIVRFQREFYLFPHPGGPGFLWNFVFGGRYSMQDLAAAPRDTSLRRAVLDRLARGEEIYDLPGVRFHSPEEWGSQPYMRTWDQNPERFTTGLDRP